MRDNVELNLRDLPEYLVEEILLFRLEPYQLLNALPVNSQISRELSTDAIWQPIFQKYFPWSVKRVDETFKLAFIRVTRQILMNVKYDPHFLSNVSNRLKSNFDFMLAAVKINGWALQYASFNLQNNLAIVRAAIAKNGNALSYASQALQDSSAVVLEAVSQNGHAFQYASDRLRSHRTTVLAAVASDSRAYQHAHGDLRHEITNYLWCLRIIAALEFVVGVALNRDTSPTAGGVLFALAAITGLTSCSYRATARLGYFFSRNPQQALHQGADIEVAEEAEELGEEHKLL